MIQALPLDANFDVVLAMPMHWRKRWERGFNQAELLAQPVAKRYGLPLASNLRRSRYTKSQAGLSESARRKNLRRSFSLHRPAELAGKRILLIDDVLTTGATLRAAAAILKKAGTKHVSALTLARVDRAISSTTGLKSAAAAWGNSASFSAPGEQQPAPAGHLESRQRSPLAD